VLTISIGLDLQEAVEKHRVITQDHLDIARKQFEIQQHNVKQNLDDRQRSCLHLFRLTENTEDATYEWYKDRVPERVEGTCAWFLEHDNFQEWVRQKSGPLLVSADPGCGKSVLAKYLIDHVLAQGATVCYFFFKDQDQNTVCQALCALLHQLFSQRPALIKHAVKQYEKDGNRLIKSTKSLWTILSNAAQDEQAGPVIVVLDALDECVESEFKDLMRNIESQSLSNQTSHGELKYLLTSRPYEQIVARFRGLLKAFPRIHIPGEEESETIGREVNQVINYRVERLAEHYKLADEIKLQLADHLLRIEHRTYLWVHLVFDHLETEGFKKTRRGIQLALETLPMSVNQAYEKILTKSKDPLMVRKALAIILAANRPLTLSELNVAIEIDETTQSAHDLELEGEEDFKSRLRSWCGLFVVVHHDKIFFLHQTAREFLLADLSTYAAVDTDLKWHRSITIQHAHAIIAELCMRFLKFLNAETTLLDEEILENRHHIVRGKFLHYSARFWSLHFRKACVGTEDVTMINLALNFSPGSKVFTVWTRIVWGPTETKHPGFSTNLMVASALGLDAVVKRLLDEGADANARGGQYGNALYAAAVGGYKSVVKLLLESDANINASGGSYGTALHAALTRGHEAVAKLLLEKGADPNAQCGYSSVLKEASAGGYTTIVKLLLETHANINAPGGSYDNALQAASAAGHETVVKLLLEKGADPNARCGYSSALEAASAGGHTSIVKLLLDAGANVNAQSENICALKAASSAGHETVVKLLLDAGADVNAQGGSNKNALQEASLAGHEAVVKLLLDAGANVNAQGGNNKNALQVASFAGHETVVKLLINAGATVNNKDLNENALQLASLVGHEAVVKLLLDAGANVNARSKNDNTALQVASFAGHETVVKLLLDPGANTKAQRSYNDHNALQAASGAGHEAIVKLLLNAGARINAPVRRNSKARDLAFLRDRSKAFMNPFEALRLEEIFRMYDTALQAAAGEGHEPVVRLLLRKGANVDTQHSYYRDALKVASDHGHEKIVKILLE
jgi:ankyrin repeat protein